MKLQVTFLLSNRDRVKSEVVDATETEADDLREFLKDTLRGDKYDTILVERGMHPNPESVFNLLVDDEYIFNREHVVGYRIEYLDE